MQGYRKCLSLVMIRLFTLFILVIWSNLSGFSQSTVTLASEVNLDSLVKIVREFSGEDSTRVKDSVVRIQHRVSNKGNNLAADYLVERLKAFGLQVETFDYRKNGRNIVATYKGKTNPDSIYIICAHYDAVADYCADDNASGSAAILEAARIMSQYCFTNTIKFAFWDEEELGLIGSKYYADTAFAHGDRIMGVYNIDMMGYDGDSNKVFDIHTNADPENQVLKDTVLHVLKLLQLDLVPNVINPGTNRSDHASFWKHDYPAIFCGESFIGGDPNPSFHSNKDRIDLFDLHYYHKLAQLAVGTIVELAGVIPTAIEEDTVVTCDFFTYNDTTFYASTVFYDSLKTTHGCDSVYVLHLTILPHSQKIDTIVACEFYTYKNNTYYKSGMYHDTLIANNGCDSFYVMDLTLLPIYRSTATINACDHYVFNDKDIKQSGIYCDTFVSQVGCDSIECLNLTIFQNYYWSDTISACGKFIYSNHVFTSTGIYQDTFVSQYSLHLTIYPEITSFDTVQACTEFMYRNRIYNQSGIYKDTLMSHLGCDSFYIFDLVITDINTTINKSKDQLQAVDTSCTYQWYTCNSGVYLPIFGANDRVFDVKATGNYAVQLNKNQCVDTSICIQVELGNATSFRFPYVNIFPNPTNGIVHISHLPENENLAIQLYNLNGVLLYENRLFNERETTLALPIEAGVYILKIESKKGRGAYRLVKIN